MTSSKELKHLLRSAKPDWVQAGKKLISQARLSRFLGVSRQHLHIILERGAKFKTIKPSKRWTTRGKRGRMVVISSVVPAMEALEKKRLSKLTLQPRHPSVTYACAYSRMRRGWPQGEALWVPAEERG